ncbi:glycosyltransferase family 2 protein [Candidatus Woesearchaeota archaeon CG_4_10_14_0_2_um_filter_33_13]|nr:MAG: glycosyltransferase family 2 protein [Candidatus Woesearchaeota archaeon CG_4_10_14_0_2_um_filter_33_13]
MNEWIVIPAYNEERRIVFTLEETKKYAQNIIVIDDGSTDNTSRLIKTIPNVHSLQHIINLGKGSALKTGCDYAIKCGAKKIIVMDSDGQHDPAEIPTFVKLLETYDLVFGVRKRSKNMPLILKFGNWFLNIWTRLLFKIKLDDTQSGYRAFTDHTYKLIRWQSSDYSVETEMIANLGRSKLKYTQIPIQTIYHDNYKGTTFLDGITIAFNMLVWRLRR